MSFHLCIVNDLYKALSHSFTILLTFTRIPAPIFRKSSFIYRKRSSRPVVIMYINSSETRTKKKKVCLLNTVLLLCIPACSYAHMNFPVCICHFHLHAKLNHTSLRHTFFLTSPFTFLQYREVSSYDVWFSNLAHGIPSSSVMRKLTK